MSKDFKKELLKSKQRQGAKSKLVAVRLPNDIYDELSQLSKTTDMPLSKVIVFALKKALGKNES